jgi:4-amino-4-deoxy-L-arabinose transferase-like glycosyltransferase
MSRRSWRPALPPGPALVVLASVLLFLACLSWASVVPGFRTPDEMQHTNSVVRVAEGGGWPGPSDARVRDEVGDAWRLSGTTLDGQRTVFPGTRSSWSAPLFQDVEPTKVEDRVSFQDLAGGRDETWPDQMTQHPPGYYAVAAVVYDLLGAGGWRYDQALLLLRALTALMVAASVPVCCYVTARRLTERDDVASIAAFVPLLIPQVHFIGGGVTNDGATMAAAAALWALLLTVTCAGPTRGRLLLLALAMAAACWTKGTALSLLPCVPFGIALAYRRARGPGLRRWALPALAAVTGTSVVAFLLGGWWWALNLLRHGRLQPAGVAHTDLGGEVLGAGEYLLVWLHRLRWTFFGEVGGREPTVLGPLTVTLAAIVLLCTAAGLLSRRRLADRGIMLLGVALTGGVLFATTYGAHLEAATLPGIQGRYLFVLVVPVATLVAAGLVSLAAVVRIPGRWLLVLVVVSAPGVALFGLRLGFTVFYQAPGATWDEAVYLFASWSAAPLPVVALLPAGMAACTLVAAWMAVRQARDAAVPAVPVEPVRQLMGQPGEALVAQRGE